MRKQSWGIAFIIMCLSLALSGCSSGSKQTESEYDRWGSFTSDKSFSYDQKYYAIQEAEQVSENARQIKVSIYISDHDKPIFFFEPARVRDFWGICWESATYNIWIQSGDIGVLCYRYDDMQWVLDETAQRPDDIVSKYDN